MGKERKHIMKKTYTKPFAQVVKIDTSDIMRTSLTLSFDLDGSEDGSDFSSLFNLQ
jgi:hypothetical protein